MNLSTDVAAVAGLTMQKTFADKWRSLDPSSHTRIEVMHSVEDAFEHVRQLGNQSKAEGGTKVVHAFVTGSVHLIGRALGILEGPEAL